MPRPGDHSREPAAAAVELAGEFSGPSFAAANARDAAFQTLELMRNPALRLSAAWQTVQSSAALSPIDRNLSRELAFGVFRREMTLDVLLRKLVRRPVSEIEPPLKTILHLGLYQLVFANQIPQHAAVHETVELAKRVGRLRWSGFVNGVLRAASRLVTERFTTTAGPSAVPVGQSPREVNDQTERGQNHTVGRYRMLTEPVFPDPATDLCGYFQQAYGFPAWIAARWSARWSPEELHRLGHWQRESPPLFLRVNLLKTSREALQEKFHAAGLQTVPECLPESLRVLSGGRIEDWPGYHEGLFSVQDLSAMHAARRLAPRPGSSVLDLCAAPGGKTCHLAEWMGDAGEVLAVDVTPIRLSRIVENAQRLGLKSVHALLGSEDGHDLPQGPFEFVLADVPCSNTGVLGRRPEVLRELTPDTLQELVRLQADLLQHAAARVKPGGRLLYSTCSIEADENEHVLQTFLQHWPEFRLVESALLLPGAPADGGYQALLERVSDGPLTSCTPL